MVTYCFLNCLSPTPTSTSWQCLNHPRQPQTLIVNCQLWHHMTTQSTTKKHWQHMVPTSWQCWLIIPWRGNNVAETSGWEVHLTYSCTLVSFQYTYCFCSVWWNQTKFYNNSTPLLFTQARLHWFIVSLIFPRPISEHQTKNQIKRKNRLKIACKCKTFRNICQFNFLYIFYKFFVNLSEERFIIRGAEVREWFKNLITGDIHTGMYIQLHTHP